MLLRRFFNDLLNAEKSNQEADHGLFDENEDPKQIGKNEDINQSNFAEEQVALRGRTKTSSECSAYTEKEVWTNQPSADTPSFPANFKIVHLDSDFFFQMCGCPEG